MTPEQLQQQYLLWIDIYNSAQSEQQRLDALDELAMLETQDPSLRQWAIGQGYNPPALPEEEEAAATPVPTRAGPAAPAAPTGSAGTTPSVGTSSPFTGAVRYGYSSTRGMAYPYAGYTTAGKPIVEPTPSEQYATDYLAATLAQEQAKAEAAALPMKQFEWQQYVWRAQNDPTSPEYQRLHAEELQRQQMEADWERFRQKMDFATQWSQWLQEQQRLAANAANEQAWQRWNQSYPAGTEYMPGMEPGGITAQQAQRIGLAYNPEPFRTVPLPATTTVQPQIPAWAQSVITSVAKEVRKKR